jgi:hypothetical protein
VVVSEDVENMAIDGIPPMEAMTVEIKKTDGPIKIDLQMKSTGAATGGGPDPDAGDDGTGTDSPGGI